MKKKGQEEMIGFVLIIVLVAVIALVFLAIQIRRPAEIQKSGEIQDFLYSSLKLTTDCKMNNYSFENVEDLTGDCYEGRRCVNGNPCEILNKTFSELIDVSFNKKGWEFRMFKGNFSEEGILRVKKGNQSSNMEEGEIITGEGIHLNLRIYS